MSDPANTKVLAGEGLRHGIPGSSSAPVNMPKRGQALRNLVQEDLDDSAPKKALNPLEYPVPETPMETVDATNMAATEFYAAGVVPKFDHLRSRVMQLTGRNPSLTTIHKAYKAWQASSLAVRFQASHNAADKLPESVRSTVNASIDVIYAACLNDAHKKFDGHREECLKLVEQANETAATALAERESAAAQNTLMQEQINALQVQLQTAQEMLGLARGNLDAEKAQHDQTRAANVAIQQELSAQMAVLDRSLKELEGTRKHLLLEVEQLRDEKKRVQADAARAKTLADEAHARAKTLQEELDAQKAATEDIRGQVSRLQGQKELIAEQLGDTHALLNQTRHELAVTGERLNQRNAELESLQATEEKLRDDIEVLQVQHDRLRGRLELATRRAMHRRAARKRSATKTGADTSATAALKSRKPVSKPPKPAG